MFGTQPEGLLANIGRLNLKKVSVQAEPADMPDVFPHETAVAWTRHYLKKFPLTKGKGLDAMERELTARLNECRKHINRNMDVSDLCSSYTRRMQELAAAKGERLNH